MNDLAHMKMRWTPEFREEDKSWNIVTEESTPWAICEIAPHLPGDVTGELTARAICDAHNAEREVRT